LIIIIPFRYLLAIVIGLCPFVLYKTWRYALDVWPGGDDGGGLNWGLAVGGATLLASILLWIECIILLLVNIDKKKKG